MAYQEIAYEVSDGVLTLTNGQSFRFLSDQHCEFWLAIRRVILQRQFNYTSGL